MKALTPQAAPAAPETRAATPRRDLLQRKCACGGSAGLSGACEECGKKQSVISQGANGPAAPASVPPAVHEVLGTAGRPLDTPTRTFMESKLGHDFSRVRVHTDARAAESARAVNALAYTVGRDVVFAAGRYAPGTREGRKLLAHELAHTVQQGRDMRPAGQDFGISTPGDPAELEADRAAALAGAPVALRPVAAPMLARQPVPPFIPVPPPLPTPRPEVKQDKKEDFGEVGLSEKRGHRDSTWGWGAPETNNVYQECKNVAMARPRFLAFMASLPSSANRPQGRQTDKPQEITLGITEASPADAKPPTIDVTQVQRGTKPPVYKLNPTHAEMPPIRSAYTQAGSFVEGKVSISDPECSWKRIELNAQTGEAKAPITWNIRKGGEILILLAEREHCDDIRHAFDITLGLYAGAINNEAAADREYSSKESAVKDVV
ncbi:MAG TPA: DUF4157 domain-containing protein, partial [Pyrinomonadaceae bacterium]